MLRGFDSRRLHHRIRKNTSRREIGARVGELLRSRVAARDHTTNPKVTHKDVAAIKRADVLVNLRGEHRRAVWADSCEARELATPA